MHRQAHSWKICRLSLGHCNLLNRSKILCQPPWTVHQWKLSSQAHHTRPQQMVKLLGEALANVLLSCHLLQTQDQAPVKQML